MNSTNLLLSDVEELGHVGPLRGGQILFRFEHLLQLENLTSRESRSNFFLLGVFGVFVGAHVFVEFRTNRGFLLPLQSEIF